MVTCASLYPLLIWCMPAANIILQMKAFKDGTRPATVMHQLSKGITDEQIDRIADYFAATKR